MFKFKGISSNDMQVIVEEEEEFIARAAHKYEQIDVDGRDGAEFNELGYSVVERPIRVQCLNVDKVDEILAWLNGEGEFEYKGRKTIARFYSELEPKRSSWIRIIDTTFIRDPFWYKANEEYLLVKDDKNKNVSGESIHIEDSSDARCELEIGGNQKQDTREGYNILPYPFTDTTFQANGIKYTDLEDGSVNVNGTNTGYSGFALVKNMNFKAGTYTFYGTPNTNVDKNSFRIRLGDADNNDKLIDVVGNVPITLTFDKEMNINVILQVLAEKEITISNVVWKPMIILGADINKKYEQYGASPSFAYPSSVKAVGDVKNILNMSNAKGGTSGGITCNMIADGSYTYKGTASSKAINIWLLGSYNNKTSIFRLEPGTYYIDGVVLFDGNNVLANPDTAKIFTFINAHDITGVRVLDAVLENTYDETKYPIIAEIDHEIPWVPYDYGSVQVNMQNKNYLANIAQSSVTENGITTTYDGEKFLCKGTTTSSFFGASKKTNIYLPIDTYTFSQNAISRGRFVLRLYYRDNTFSTHYISTATWRVSFTTSKEAVSFGIFCDSLSSGINIDYTVYVQLERGATNTDWIKPEIQQRIFPVQQEMLEGDTFVRQDGKWYEKHCWKKMLLNGTEKVGVSGASTNEILAIVYDINNAVDGFGYSNYFLYSSQVELNKMSVYNGGKNLRVNVSKMQFADSEPFKAKLKELYEAGTPVIIYYKLAEPILLECTKAQSKVLDEIYNKIHTYKNITNILAESAEVNPIINVEYLVETNEKIINDGNYISSPILRLEKTKYNDVELTINDIRFKYHFEQDKYVEIDCEQKSVKCDGVDRYRQIEIDYKFPKLNLKENNIIMHLGDCKIKVLRKDRWL